MPKAHPVPLPEPAVPSESASHATDQAEAFTAMGVKYKTKKRAQEFFSLNPSFSPLLQPLLLWQSLSLFWLCGLWGPHAPVWALSVALLLFYMDGRLRAKGPALWAMVLFSAGFVTVFFVFPERPPVPSWTQEQGQPVTLRLEGQVVRVQSLVEGRWRIFLRHLKPVEERAGGRASVARSFSGANLSQIPLDGLAVWTWEWSEKARTEQVRPEQKHLLQRPIPGQYVRLTAKVRTTEGYENPWGSNFGFYWQSQGVFWRLWTRDNRGAVEVFGKPFFWAAVREDIVQTFSHILHEAAQGKNAQYGQALAFLPTLLLGEKFTLAQGTVEGMRVLSLVHSLALSGQHLAVVGFAVWLALRALSTLSPVLFLHMPRYKAYILCSFPLAWAYAWLGNAPSSLLRALCLLTVVFLLLWRQQVFTLRHALVWTACILTLMWPLALYDMGLQLSLLCVASLCLVMPALSYGEQYAKKRGARSSKSTAFTRKALSIRRFFVQCFVISCTIQVVLLPYMLYYFPPAGLYFWANCLWLPVLAMWVLPWGALGLLLSLCASKSVALFAISLAVLPCQALVSVIQFFEQYSFLQSMAVLRPHASTIFAWIPLMLALALLVGRISWKDSVQGRKDRAPIPSNIYRLFVLAACLLCVAPLLRYMGYAQSSVRLTLFDVGHGQAIALNVAHGQRVLVDGGGSTSKRFDPGTQLVMPSLLYNEAPRVYGMINSHPDTDHLRGLLHMLPHLQSDFFYTNGHTFGKTNQELWQKMANSSLRRESLHAGMHVPLTEDGHDPSTAVFLEVLWPPQGVVLNKNNASLILRLVQGEGQHRQGLALLCGDASRASLQGVLASGQDISAKVLLVPHHGALDALLPEFYVAVGAEVALVSAGRQNSYGHPHRAVREALEAHGMQVYGTHSVGAIRVTFANTLHLDF